MYILIYSQSQWNMKTLNDMLIDSRDETIKEIQGFTVFTNTSGHHN